MLRSGYGLATTNNYIAVYNDLNDTYTSVGWGTIGTDFDAGRRNRVRYDSPTFAGFTLSTSWGEDDEWDVALRYANEWNGLRVAASASYLDDTDDNGCAAFAIPAHDEAESVNCEERQSWGGSIAFLHVPSGIHLQGGYNEREFDNDDGDDTVTNAREANNAEHWWVAAGIQFRANSLGQSDISIQYIETNDITLGYDYTNWGISFVQNIDAVGATAYLSYLHHEAEDNVNLGFDLDAEIDQVTAGMRVRF